MVRFETQNNESGDVSAVPTPLWVSQVEISIGSEKVETIHSSDIYTEALGFKSLDEMDSINELVRADATYGLTGSVIPTGRSFSYLPLPSFLNSSKLYIKGLEEEVRIRLTFPAQLWGTQQVSLQGAMLIVSEHQLSRTEEDAFYQAMRSGISFGAVVRQRQQFTVSRTTGNTNTLDLTGVNGHSAGLTVYAQANGNFSAVSSGDRNNLVHRLPLPRLALTDEMGSKITEDLEGAWNEGVVWKKAVGTPFPARPNMDTYIIPFSSAFRHSVENGVHSGERFLTGKDKLVLGSATANATITVNVCNYAYISLVIFGGKLTRVVRQFSA